MRNGKEEKGKDLSDEELNLYIMKELERRIKNLKEEEKEATLLSEFKIKYFKKKGKDGGYY